MEKIRSHFQEAADLLNTFLQEEKNIESIHNAGELMVEAIASGSKIISCGNGGSMCDAMHFAEELTGRFRDARKALPAAEIGMINRLDSLDGWLRHRGLRGSPAIFLARALFVALDIGLAFVET